MQTQLADFIKDTPQGQTADRILRSCVHCGFCTATCPTYQLLGDELDGPRGRIYLIKQMLEGETPTARTRTHLDRCLTCRSCETTCPSGVQYGQLLDIGRAVAEQHTQRPWHERLLRRALLSVLPYPRRFGPLLKAGQAFRPVLPAAISRKVPPPQTARPRPDSQHARRVLVLEGCAQKAATPNTNAATARVFDRLGISLISAAKAGCCGAANHHLSDHGGALRMIKDNIDAWWPYLQDGVEAILVTASGCGVHVKDYGNLMAHDSQYADKARTISDKTRDLVEVLEAEDLSPLRTAKSKQPIAFHAPCTLQHGLKLNGRVESLLQNLGYELAPIKDSHLCCGSAGTYSITQPKLSKRLLSNKLDKLQQPQVSRIATANVGCQLHLQTQADVPVLHWIELLAEQLEHSRG